MGSVLSGVACFESHETLPKELKDGVEMQNSVISKESLAKLNDTFYGNEISKVLSQDVDDDLSSHHEFASEISSLMSPMITKHRDVPLRLLPVESESDSEQSILTEPTQASPFASPYASPGRTFASPGRTPGKTLSVRSSVRSQHPVRQRPVINSPPGQVLNGFGEW